MGTSYRRFCPIKELAHGGEQWLAIDQLTQLLESSNRDARFCFLLQLFTPEWTQHPLRHRELWPSGKFHHKNGRGRPPQIADDLNLCVIEGMMTITDLR
jgi:hypothetical protein